MRLMQNLSAMLGVAQRSANHRILKLPGRARRIVEQERSKDREREEI